MGCLRPLLVSNKLLIHSNSIQPNTKIMLAFSATTRTASSRFCAPFTNGTDAQSCSVATTPTRSRRYCFPTASGSSLPTLRSPNGGVTDAAGVEEAFVKKKRVEEASPEAARRARRSADWKAARAYNSTGSIFTGRVEGFNEGGLLIRFYSLLGFLPFSQLSPTHDFKEPQRSTQEIAKDLTGSLLSVKVLQAEEEKRKLIFSEKEAMWLQFSKTIKVGDIFAGRVASVEDYGAFVRLLCSDGLYHLTGLVHVSEIAWDVVHDARDMLSRGQEVRVQVITIDRIKCRITLSIKHLEEDPLLETLDKVIPQDDSADSDKMSMSYNEVVEPLPGLEAIFQELLREDGIDDVRISRQGFEKRVVSQDLQLWLSNGPPVNGKFTLLARAGRQVQEVQLTTSLDQQGVKKALQHVLERVP